MFGVQVEVIKKAYMQGEIEVEHNDDEEDGEEEHAASPRNVGHNIYILAHQVTQIYFYTHTYALCQLSGLYHLPSERTLEPYGFSARSRNYVGHRLEVQLCNGRNGAMFHWHSVYP